MILVLLLSLLGCLSVSVCLSAWLLRGCQTINKVGHFRLPRKSTNKNLVCHAKIGRIRPPLKSSNFIVQLERVLFSTRKSPNLYAVTRRNTL